MHNTMRNILQNSLRRPAQHLSMGPVFETQMRIQASESLSTLGLIHLLCRRPVWKNAVSNFNVMTRRTVSVIICFANTQCVSWAGFIYTARHYGDCDNIACIALLIWATIGGIITVGWVDWARSARTFMQFPIPSFHGSDPVQTYVDAVSTADDL